MIASGCGGSSSNNGPTDSGTADVSVDQGAPETGPEAAVEAGGMDAAMACTTDADLTMLQNVPDAEIGDSSATDLSCYTCMQTNCATQLATCNADCTCKTDVLGFLQCINAGTSILMCGGSLITDTTALPLIACLAGSAAAQLGGSGPGCLKQCGVTVPEGGIPDASGVVDSGSQDAKAD
jgi:hypothetical protein